MTDTAAKDLVRILRWPLRLTWAGLWAERISRCFWPLWTLLIGLLAVLAFGVQDHLPLEAAWGGLVLSAAAAIWFTISGLRAFHRPKRAEALARLDAALPGQPLAALRDAQAIGVGDEASMAVWQAHRARMAARAAKATAVAPDLRLSRRDPLGLRYLALTALVMALVFGSLWRVASITQLGAGSAQAMANGPTWEGWAQPPAYSGKPALYLNDQTGALRLPQGTKVQLRFYGEVGALTLAETVSASVTPPPASDVVQEFVVLQNGMIRVNGPKGREWQVVALADAPPSVTADAAPTREKDGRMKLPFAAKDDYGITKGQAEITLDLAAIDRRFGLKIAPEARAPLVLDLPLPISGNRADFSDALIEDISKEAFSNLPVIITLSVSDARDQSAKAAPLHAILPGKRFFDPLAAALIEMRRDLLWSRENARDVVGTLKAITNRPEDVIRDEAAFLRLRVALRRLDASAATLDVKTRDEIADALWEISLLVEEGDLASARERLDRAQDRLNEAIRNGADTSEIDQLMQELREAMDDYMEQLAQEQQRNPDNDMAENQQRMEITGDQLQKMMDELQRLLEEGKTDEAAKLMEMLRQLMENMQVTQGQGGEGGPGGKALKDLSDTLRQQQDLSDDSFNQLQNGPEGSQPGTQGDPGEGQPDDRSLAERQRDLRKELENLKGQGGLPGAGTEKGDAGRKALSEAEGAMDEAEKALREGDLSGALDQQAEAMDKMRDGIRALNEAQRQAQRDQSQGGEDVGRNDPNSKRDPLGRDPGEAGRIGSDRNALQGRDVYRRAQDLMDEIRKRSGEQARPEGERDYLKRLLDLF